MELHCKLVTVQALPRQGPAKRGGRTRSVLVQAAFGSKAAAKATYVCIDCAAPAHGLRAAAVSVHTASCAVVLQAVWSCFRWVADGRHHTATSSKCKYLLLKSASTQSDLYFRNGVGGYIYDGRVAFDALPSSYRCPVCNSPKRRHVRLTLSLSQSF